MALTLNSTIQSSHAAKRLLLRSAMMSRYPFITYDARAGPPWRPHLLLRA